MKLPTLLITADLGKLAAYRIGEANEITEINSLEIREGTDKLSDQVRDQAGGFPMPGSPLHSTAERLPLERELELKSLRQIADRIGEILASEKNPVWGLAAPITINAALLEHLQPEDKQRLHTNLPLNLGNLPVLPLLQRFEAAYK